MRKFLVLPGSELVDVFNSLVSSAANFPIGSGVGNFIVSVKSIMGTGFLFGAGVSSVKSTIGSGLSDPDVNDPPSRSSVSGSVSSVGILSSTKTTSSDSCDETSSGADSGSDSIISELSCNWPE